MNSLLNLKLCVNCVNFLNSHIIDNEKYRTYLDDLNQGGLHFPNVSIFNLILNCEILYRKYETYLVHNGSNEAFINKLFKDLDIVFPSCNICLSIKNKAIMYFFNLRSNAITSLHLCQKRKKIMYGTATVKRRKV